MNEYYRYDADGYYIEPVHASECPERCTPVRPVDGLYYAKWTGNLWVETGTPPPLAPDTEPNAEDLITALLEGYQNG